MEMLNLSIAAIAVSVLTILIITAVKKSASPINNRSRLQARPVVDTDTWYAQHWHQSGIPLPVVEFVARQLAARIGCEPVQIYPDDSFNNDLHSGDQWLFLVDDDIDMELFFCDMREALNTNFACLDIGSAETFQDFLLLIKPLLDHHFN